MDKRGTPPALFHRAVFVNAIVLAISKGGPRHARARGLCQVPMSDAKRVIYDAGAFCGLRADRMRARRDGKGDRLGGLRKRSSRRAIVTCATRHAKEERGGEKRIRRITGVAGVRA